MPGAVPGAVDKTVTKTNMALLFSLVKETDT